MSRLILAMVFITCYFPLSAQKKHKDQGEVLYRKYECVACHGKTGDKPFDLTLASKKYTMEQLEAYIKQPKSFGNERMPAFELIIRREDFPVLLNYVLTLSKQSEERR